MKMIKDQIIEKKRVSRKKKKNTKKENTYNSRYSLVVTDPATNQPLSGLTLGERTGSRIFHWVWSYVTTDQIIGVTKYSRYPVCFSPSGPAFVAPCLP